MNIERIIKTRTSQWLVLGFVTSVVFTANAQTIDLPELDTQGAEHVAQAELPYLTDESFCQTAQQLMVGTSELSRNINHQDYDAFVESKAATDPLVTHQYVSHLLADGASAEIPISISCKIKTAERINHSLEEAGVADELMRAKGEQSCRFINQHTLQQVMSNDSAESLGITRQSILFDEDESVYIGPLWLRPWPYQIAYLDDDNQVHVRSKTLHVEHSFFIPMPARFMGVHYCHLISPEYLDALSRGQMTAPKLL